MRNALIALVVALLAVLAITNPSKEDFARGFADKMNAELATELGIEGAVGNILGGLSQNLIQGAIEQ